MSSRGVLDCQNAEKVDWDTEEVKPPMATATQIIIIPTGMSPMVIILPSAAVPVNCRQKRMPVAIMAASMDRIPKGRKRVTNFFPIYAPKNKPNMTMTTC